MESRPLQIAAGLLLSATMLAFSACGGDKPPTEKRTVVLAAASLTEAVGEAAEAFERSHPGFRIDCSFGGSQVLAAQIESGAPAGVFLSADDVQIRRVQSRLDPPIAFATGRLVVIAPAGAPFVDAADALNRAERIALAGPHVPAGRLARRACRSIGVLEAVETRALSQEESVRGVLVRVLMGEADLGMVYATDAAAAPPGALRLYELPKDAAANPTYWGAVASGAPQDSAAPAFLDFLVSSESARTILRSHGFDTP